MRRGGRKRKKVAGARGGGGGGGGGAKELEWSGKILVMFAMKSPAGVTFWGFGGNQGRRYAP